MVKIHHATLLSLIITGIASVGAQSQRYYIKSVSSSKCLTVKDSKFQNGTPAVMLVCFDSTRVYNDNWFFRNDCNESLAQKWLVNPGKTTISVQGGFCLDAKTGKSFWQPKTQVSESHSWIVDAGSPVVIWKCGSGKPWQMWVSNNGGNIRIATNQSASLSKLYLLLIRMPIHLNPI